VLLGAFSSGAAFAQADDRRPEWKEFDFKPFVPPIVPLPPNARVAPGGLDFTQSPSDPARITNPGNPTPTGPGLRLTIPTR
jgi:hypothetical protein